MPNFWWPLNSEANTAADDAGSGSRTSPRRRLTQLARTSVTELSGIGPARQRALSSMGIENVLDLLMTYPRRYADRSHPTLIADADIGEVVVLEACVVSVTSRYSKSRRSIVDVVIGDRSGELTVTFFNQPYRREQLRPGEEVVVFGKVDAFRNRGVMTNPGVDLVGDQTGAIIPIYPQSAKARVTSRDLTRYLKEALSRAKVFADPLAVSLRDELGLVDRTTAFRAIHQPVSMEQKDLARRRLAFDELWRLQLSLVMSKRAQQRAARGIAHRLEPSDDAPGLVGEFLAQLPYALTNAQRRVLEEIASDLVAPSPMHRLLQGDVGSGKTVVALATLLYGVQGNYQGALMVPTEVLAEQHFAVARELLLGLVVKDPSRLTGTRPVHLALLTSTTSQKERAQMLLGLSSGEVDIVVGTHALLTDEVRFRSLGVVIIDEQHRFGVDQRAKLRDKGAIDPERPHDPDLLVMTATPIPRTAAMTVYGDLDYSELDELPPGRTRVRTQWITEERDEHWVWERVLGEVASGHQAFVVCPRVHAKDLTDEIDDSGLIYIDPDLDAGEQLFGVTDLDEEGRVVRSVIEEHDRLSRAQLASVRVGLLHGQMPTKEKDSVIEEFRHGSLDVLVATTVIEVGVDIPRATVMVIEDADRFGIAQLHQLRGRVGRGDDDAYCFLLGYQVSEKSAKRLSALVKTSDGFALAETDLELRGEGTVLGVRQKGRNDLRLASLARDRELVMLAREVATGIIDADPQLEHSPDLRNELVLFIGDDGAEYLERS